MSAEVNYLVSIMLPEKLNARLNEMAEAEGVSQRELIVRLLKEAVERG